MASRHDLQILFENLMENKNVYFQPPESVKMKYPAIVYELDNIISTYANNGVYSSHKKYSVTLIDFNPDSLFVDKLTKLPKCRFVTHYKSDNLNHWVFSLYD